MKHNKYRLDLYTVNMKYIRDLHNKDNRVSSVSPQIGKEHRVFVGVVVICNDRSYIIPLSHPKEKHKNMKPRADFDKVLSPTGKLLGVLNYNLMIPVNRKDIAKVSLKLLPGDDLHKKQYKALCADEIRWCRKHAEDIINKANVLYTLCTTDSGYKGKVRCLNFKKLEHVCDNWKNRV